MPGAPFSPSFKIEKAELVSRRFGVITSLPTVISTNKALPNASVGAFSKIVRLRGVLLPKLIKKKPSVTDVARCDSVQPLPTGCGAPEASTSFIEMSLFPEIGAPVESESRPWIVMSRGESANRKGETDMPTLYNSTSAPFIRNPRL